MNTNPITDAPDNQPSTHPLTRLNEVRLDGPRTIPALWDLSEMLSKPTLSPNGHSERKNGSNPPVAPEQPFAPDGKAGKVISELSDWDALGFVFQPY